MENTGNKPDSLDLRLTESAIQQVKRLLIRDNKEGHSLRVAVTDGGCSGFSYQLNFETEGNPDDTVMMQDGVKVVIDHASVPFLKGIVIDYRDGLYGGGFKFNNPNATATCGCGTSFST